MLHTDGNVFDLHIGIDVESVFFAQRFNFFRRFPPAQHESAFVSEDDIFGDGKIAHELKMLMHHADAESRRIVRIFDRLFFAVYFYRTAVGMIEPEQNTHERRFARAVFAEYRVDFTVFYLQRDIVVCNDAGKFLSDVKHFDYVIIAAHSRLRLYT